MNLMYLAIALSIYLLAAAVWDLRTLRVPNWLTLPVMGGILVWRLMGMAAVNGLLRSGLRSSLCLPALDLRFVPFWVGSFVAWRLRALGGGDAKLLMVLFGVFPEVELFYVFLAVAGVFLVLIVIGRRVRSRRLQALVLTLRSRCATMAPACTRKERSVVDDGRPQSRLQVRGGPGDILPWLARQRLEMEAMGQEREPFAFLISLAGIVYVWGARGVWY